MKQIKTNTLHRSSHIAPRLSSKRFFCVYSPNIPITNNTPRIGKYRAVHTAIMVKHYDRFFLWKQHGNKDNPSYAINTPVSLVSCDYVETYTSP